MLAQNRMSKTTREKISDKLSRKRLAANRANAARSTGPRTRSGVGTVRDWRERADWREKVANASAWQLLPVAKLGTEALTKKQYLTRAGFLMEAFTFPTSG
jgi:hypothetical protein